jgi:hypothetical protein
MHRTPVFSPWDCTSLEGSHPTGMSKKSIHALPTPCPPERRMEPMDWIFARGLNRSTAFLGAPRGAIAYEELRTWVIRGTCTAPRLPATTPGRCRPISGRPPAENHLTLPRVPCPLHTRCSERTARALGLSQLPIQITRRRRQQQSRIAPRPQKSQANMRKVDGWQTLAVPYRGPHAPESEQQPRGFPFSFFQRPRRA